MTVSVVVARPREEVFAYLSDIANHAEFCDHFLTEWHLTRIDTVGVGAGARFRVNAPLNRFGWSGVSLVEVDPPRRIVQAGRGGKYNRVKSRTIYTLEPDADGSTRVELSVETEPATLSDRIMESLGSRRWFKRQNSKALGRLRRILEDGEGRGCRATIAGAGG